MVASNVRVFVVEWVAGIAGGVCQRHRARSSVGSEQSVKGGSSHDVVMQSE